MILYALLFLNLYLKRVFMVASSTYQPCMEQNLLLNTSYIYKRVYVNKLDFIYFSVHVVAILV